MRDDIVCPLDGELIYLENVKDAAFSSKMLGDGVGIIPAVGILSSNQKVCSPIDGEVVMVFASKHAIGLKSKQSTEVLIHIGIDTVSLNGEGFSSYVKVGDMVTTGDPLVSVDFKKIKRKGLDPVILVLCTNKEIDRKAPQEKIKKGTGLFEIIED